MSSATRAFVLCTVAIVSSVHAWTCRCRAVFPPTHSNSDMDISHQIIWNNVTDDSIQSLSALPAQELRIQVAASTTDDDALLFHSQVQSSIRIWQAMGNVLVIPDDAVVAFSLSMASNNSRRRASRRLNTKKENCVEEDGATTFSSSTTTTAADSGMSSKWIVQQLQHGSFQINHDNITRTIRLQRASNNPVFAFHLFQNQLELTTLQRIFPLKSVTTTTDNDTTLSSSSSTRRVQSFFMARSTYIRPGEKVLDPNCGRGTFIIEAAKYWPTSTYYCMDTNRGHLDHVLMNAKSTKTAISHVRLMTYPWPYETDSVDKIVSKLPTHNTKVWLEECARVLVPETGKMVLLVPAESLEYVLQNTAHGLTIIQQRRPFKYGKNQVMTAIIFAKMEQSQGAEPSSPTTVIISNRFDWEEEHCKTEESFASGVDEELWQRARSQTIPPMVPCTFSSSPRASMFF